MNLNIYMVKNQIKIACAKQLQFSFNLTLSG